MRRRRTTICCAFALIGSLAFAPKEDDRGPLSLFPARQAWTLALNSRLVVPPAYDEARAFFAIERDRLAAYTIDSGTQLWMVTASPQTQPATGEGLVFFLQPGGLIALRAVDGVRAWQLAFRENARLRPVWDNHWLVVATTSGWIMAYRASDGELIWQRSVGSPARAVPALAADRVYVPTEDGRIVALRIEDGEALWERKLGGLPGEMLAFDDRLYVGAKDNYHYVYCLMTKDGRVDWRQRTGGDVIGRPAFDDRTIYVAAFDNMLRALDRSSGAQKWIRPLPLRPVWGPVIGNGAVIVGGQTKTLSAFLAKDGNPAGEVDAGADVSAPPFFFTDAASKLPALMVVTRHIAQGAGAIKVTRAIEPKESPIGPLPNLIQMGPAKTPEGDVSTRSPDRE